MYTELLEELVRLIEAKPSDVAGCDAATAWAKAGPTHALVTFLAFLHYERSGIDHVRVALRVPLARQKARRGVAGAIPIHDGNAY